MTFQEIIEQDKERLMRALGEARTPAEASGVVRDTCGRLLAAYNQEAPSEAQRETAYLMITAASGASPLVDSAAEPKVYVRDSRGQLVSDGSKLPSAAKRFLAQLTPPALLAVGAAALGAVPLSALVTGQALGSILPAPGVLALSLVGAIAMYLSGRLGALRSAGASPEDYSAFAETEPDREKIYRNLLALAVVMDKTMAEAAGRGKALVDQQSAQEEKRGKAQESEMISMISGLLETAGSLEDKEAAADITSQVRFYLHSHGIEAAAYSQDTAYAFDTIPAETEETVRPALIKEDKVLMKGLATRRTT